MYNDPIMIHDIKIVVNKIAEYIGVNNDMNDCQEYGRFGNDIEEGKCTWLAATAMEYGTEQQKKIMRECYGKYGK